MHSYPYELTDGECQKIMIAMAIAAKPKLLLADEPTNDLDPITQSQILRLLSRMNQLNNTTIVLIGHDLTTITQWATRITVMYCGQSVESADTAKILAKPKHPYTVALLKAMPDFGEWILIKRNCSHFQAQFPHYSIFLLAVVWDHDARTPRDSVLKSPKQNELRIISSVVTSL